MIGARVGTILAAKKRGITFADKPVNEHEELRELATDRLRLVDRDIMENTDTKLRFRKWPYHEWIGGSVLLAFGIFILFVMNYEMGMLD